MGNALALATLAGFATGVLIASVHPFGFAYGGMVALFAAAFLGAWFWERRSAYVFLALVLFALSLGMCRVLLAPHAPPAAFIPLVGQQVSLEGTIAADPDLREGSQRVTVRVEHHGTVTDVLAVVDRYTNLSYGERVRIEGTLAQPQPFDTDGGRVFRYDRFLAKDGIFLIMPLAHADTLAPPSGLFAEATAVLYAGKHAFMHGLETALPEPAASLASGIIVGGKQGLGTRLLNAFTVAGLLPVIVLSGYNVMIVAESVLAMLAFVPKRYALSIAGVLVALFVAAAGGGASAIRAGLMAGLALYARASGRTYDALRVLAAVFVLMLLLNPLSLAYDPGFQFSFMATLGLILASTPLELRLDRIPWKWLREVIASTLAAQLFVLPLLLYQTGNLSLVAIPANALVLPVIPLAMLMSFIAGCAGMLVPVIAPFVGLPAFVLLSYVVGVAEAASRIPFADVILPAFPFVLVPVAYGAIAVLLLRLRTQAAAGTVPVRQL